MVGVGIHLIGMEAFIIILIMEIMETSIMVMAVITMVVLWLTTKPEEVQPMQMEQCQIQADAALLIAQTQEELQLAI